MRVLTVLREATLNIATGTTRVALYALTLAAVIAVLAGADMATVGRIAQEATQFQLSGGSTLIYRMKAAIDGHACDSLEQLAGVKASGAIRQRVTGLIPASLPAQQVPAFDISPGFAGFTSLGDPQPSSGVLVSEDVARTLGVSRGHALALREGHPRVGDVFAYPSDGRQPGYGYAVLAPTDTRAAFDECWIEAWPAGDELISVLPTVLRPGASSGIGNPGPQLLQLNASHGTHFDGELLFHERLTRFAPAVAAAFAFALGFVGTMRRRLELAAALHAGVSPAAQALQQAAETLTWALGGCLLSLGPLAAVVSGRTATDPSALLGLAGMTMLAAAPAAILGAVAATLSIKERHLFAYFKVR